MEEKKLFGRTCPSCGELCQTHEIAKISLGAGAQINMSCDKGHKWSEFYNLSYQGYWWMGKVYDMCGDEKENKVI